MKGEIVMKKTATILVIISLLLVISCSQETPEPRNLEISPTETSQEITVSAGDTITLTGLTPNRLYGINAHGVDARARSSAPGLVPTNGGTQLLLSDGTDVTLSAAELGVSGSSEVTILEYPITQDDMVINTMDDAPAYEYWDDEGYHCRAYEEFYVVRLDELREQGLELERFAIYDYMTRVGEGGRTNRFDTDFGILDANDPYSFRDNSKDGILDLSEYEHDELYIFSQIVKSGDSDRHYEIVIQNPTVVAAGNDQSTTIAPVRGLYQVEKADCPVGKEMILELDIGDNWIGDFDFFYNTVNSRVAYDDNGNRGKRQPYLFPIDYDQTENKVVLYVGEVEEDFIFDIIVQDTTIENPGTIRLREITEDERNLISEVDLSKMQDGYMEETFILKEDTFLVPIIFKGDDPRTYQGLQLRALYPDAYFFKITSGHTNGYGYANHSSDSGEVNDRHSNWVLEHAFISNDGCVKGEFVLELSTKGFDPVVQNEVRVDASTLTDGLSRTISIGWNDKLVFENLEIGNVYGFYFGQNMPRPDDRFIEVYPGFFVFLATDTEMSVDAAGFGIEGSAEFRAIKFVPSEEASMVAKAENAIAKTDEGDLVIGCFKMRVPEPGRLHVLANTSLGSGSFSDSWYLIDIDSGYEIDGLYADSSYMLEDEEVILISRIEVRDSGDPERPSESTESFEFVLPITLTSEGQDFDAPGLYFADADSSEELILEITLQGGNLTWGGVHGVSYIRAFDYESEEPLMDFLPFSFDSNTDTATVLCYIGRYDGRIAILLRDPFLGGVETDKILIRPISDDERTLITENTVQVDEDHEVITKTADDSGFKAVFLDGVEEGARYTVSASSDGYFDVVVVGYGRYNSLGKDRPSIDVDEYYGLRAIFLEGTAQESVTIEIDKR